MSPPQAPPPEPDLEQRLRSASSVDQLMTLVYPSYWSALKCRSKLSTAAGGAEGVASGAQAAFRLSGAHGAPTRPLDEPGYAAAFHNIDVLKSKIFCLRFGFEPIQWQCSVFYNSKP